MRPWVSFSSLVLIGLWLFPGPAWAQAGAKADAKKAEQKKAESKKAEPKKSQKPDKAKKKKDDAEDEFNPNKIEFEKLKEAFQAEKTKDPFERIETIHKF